MSIFNLITIYANHTLDFLLDSKPSMDPELISYVTGYLPSNHRSYSLEQAIVDDNVEMVSFMYENGEIPSLGVLLYSAVKEGSIEVIKFAVQSGAPIDRTASVYHCTIRTDSKFNDILQYLLEQGASPHIRRSSYHNSPLGNAVAHDNLRAIQLLLKHGAIITSEDLCIARTIPIAQFLVDHGAIPTSNVLLSLIFSENYICEDDRMLSFYVEKCGVHIDLCLMEILIKHNKLDLIQYLLQSSLIPVSSSILEQILSMSPKIRNPLREYAKRDEIIYLITEHLDSHK
jgi:hypothetical protein